MKSKKNLNRRKFIAQTSAAGIGLTVIPSYVMGGQGRMAPSDKLNVALIGSGTQALKQLPGWLKQDGLQFISVCDPNKESYDYPLWGRSKGETKGAPGGREIGKKRINEYYAEKSGKSSYDACTTYADFREQLEKEQSLDAIFIMTPDHLHGAIALAGMNKNLSVATHKPIANFMNEIRLICNKAKETKVPTQCFAFQDPDNLYKIKAWIDSGVIGKVKELHRWTNRPMWPQGSPYLPEPAPIPNDFDWQLWLGPSTDRPYSPEYTHTVFRAWYEFGAGCLADMGYYGFWKDWRILGLGMPDNAEASTSFTCEIKDFRSTWVDNNIRFPHTASLFMEVPVEESNNNIGVYWYEGGIRPITPKSLRKVEKQMPKEGVMFIGENGTILADYGYRNAILLDVKDSEKVATSIKVDDVKLISQTEEMINSFKGIKPSRGSFVEAQVVAEAIGLGNLAIRMRDRLEWDNKNLKVTNMPEANKYVSRVYRKGWEL
ncbi:MAG: Gfo/Idh/MocA family oxidoreductase [Mariniphaga sp.]|nr:Gfo/Idh/MocA family oxidoreductase [Mariniphaga sp.]